MEELVAKCVEKDKVAWDEFVRRYQDIVRKAAYYRLYKTGPGSAMCDVDDIVREVFLMLWQRGLIYLLNTKNGEKREVPLNDIATRALIAVPKHRDSPYVFCNSLGKPYRDIRKSFFTALKNSGILNFRFHDLRHIYASHLVMAGVYINTVRELLGHKDIRMTIRYSHLSRDHKKRAVELLGR